MCIMLFRSFKYEKQIPGKMNWRNMQVKMSKIHHVQKLVYSILYFVLLFSLTYKCNFISSCHILQSDKQRDMYRHNIPFTGSWHYTLKYTHINYTCLNNSGCCSFPVYINPIFFPKCYFILIYQIPLSNKKLEMALFN